MSDAGTADLTRKRVTLGEKEATGTETVTVGCKMPNGILMVLYESVEETVYDQNGVAHRQKRSWPHPDKPTYTLNGCALDVGAMQKGILPEYPVVQSRSIPGGGAGLTHGIPKDFYDTWAETTGRDLVSKGLVFAAKTESSVRAIARERDAMKTGMEPIDPSKPGER
ncbi:MAG: hypothetical protein KGO96_10030, partial [Elusimicrobia bacterium]|nr:hypothetical protein [Elusimicrobiota bacterium]